MWGHRDLLGIARSSQMLLLHPVASALNIKAFLVSKGFTAYCDPGTCGAIKIGLWHCLVVPFPESANRGFKRPMGRCNQFKRSEPYLGAHYYKYNKETPK